MQEFVSKMFSMLILCPIILCGSEKIYAKEKMNLLMTDRTLMIRIIGR